jgi:cytochrome c553
MIQSTSPSWIAGWAAGWAVLFAVAPGAVVSEEFEEAAARIERALGEQNSRHINAHALTSCNKRRVIAYRLNNSGHSARALRSLEYCFSLLDLPEEDVVRPVDPVAREVASIAEVQARAAAELEEALALKPDVDNGLEIYRACAACHMAEGWGLSSGLVPQLAGQHRSVVIKQLADIRAGNRQNPMMIPYASVEAIGGAQAVADVAGYIDTLEISVHNGKGAGDDLELGARLYAETCSRCHGAMGEGDDGRFMPRIQSQHYAYLVRQFELIRDGTRLNANPEMVKLIEGFGQKEASAVLDYVSRLEPPEAFQAPEGWRNPDFD